MVIMTKPGIQKLTELDIIAYVLFATNIQSSRCSDWYFNDSVVVYQPRKIGVNDIKAGNNHTFANIKNTVRFVIYKGYSNGLTIA